MQRTTEQTEHVPYTGVDRHMVLAGRDPVARRSTSVNNKVDESWLFSGQLVVVLVVRPVWCKIVSGRLVPGPASVRFGSSEEKIHFLCLTSDITRS